MGWNLAANNVHTIKAKREITKERVHINNLPMPHTVMGFISIHQSMDFDQK